MGGKKVQMLNIREFLLSKKPTQAQNKILRGHNPQPTSEKADVPPGRRIVDRTEEQGVTTTNGKLLPCELLDDGQGKLGSDSDMEISSSSEGSIHSPVDNIRASLGHERGHQPLLLPPVIAAMEALATGATTDALRKQNKYQRTAEL